MCFLLVGLVSIAGKRGSAPTLVLSRAAVRPVRQQRCPAWCPTCLLVGWETVLVALSTLATATVFERLGWARGDSTKVVAFVVVAGVIVARRGARLRRDHEDPEVADDRDDRRSPAVYVALTVDHIDLDAARALPDGRTSAVIGATVLVLTGFGVGWVNSAADYSRYLPRTASHAPASSSGRRSAAACPVVILVGVRRPALRRRRRRSAPRSAADPIGALTTILPTWFLVPFALVAVGGLVSGAILDIYSSGLTLLALGLRGPALGGGRRSTAC